MATQQAGMKQPMCCNIESEIRPTYDEGGNMKVEGGREVMDALDSSGSVCTVFVPREYALAYCGFSTTTLFVEECAAQPEQFKFQTRFPRNCLHAAMPIKVFLC